MRDDDRRPAVEVFSKDVTEDELDALMEYAEGQADLGSEMVRVADEAEEILKRLPEGGERMSVPTMCPQCGTRMVPRDLRDEDGELIGTSWMCAEGFGGCGYQYPVYREGYWEALEAREEAEERERRREYEEYMSRTHTYYVPYVMVNGIYYQQMARVETLDDALAIVRDAYAGLPYIVYRRDYDPWLDRWYFGGKVAEGVA